MKCFMDNEVFELHWIEFNSYPCVYEAHRQLVSTTCLTRKNSQFFIALLTGFELTWGDGVAQWVEHRTRIQRPKVLIPVRSTTEKCDFFRVKNVVLTRRVGVTNPLWVYTCTRMITCARYRSCSPCQSSVDYGNTQRSSTHWTITVHCLFVSLLNV